MNKNHNIYTCIYLCIILTRGVLFFRLYGKNHLFFGRKVNKVPCIICAIWEKINFFGIYVVKTHRIIGQKSQNSARYAGAFWGEKSLFGRKVNKVPCIIATIWGKINFLGVFGVKTQWIIGQKSQNSARNEGAFWGNQ